MLTKCHVESDKIKLAKTVVCITLFIGHLTIISVCNIHITDFPWKMVMGFNAYCKILEID